MCLHCVLQVLIRLCSWDDHKVTSTSPSHMLKGAFLTCASRDLKIPCHVVICQFCSAMSKPTHPLIPERAKVKYTESEDECPTHLNYSLYHSAESSLKQVFTNGSDCFWDRDAIWSRAIYPCVNVSKHHHSFLKMRFIVSTKPFWLHSIWFTGPGVFSRSSLSRMMNGGQGGTILNHMICNILVLLGIL